VILGKGRKEAKRGKGNKKNLRKKNRKRRIVKRERMFEERDGIGMLLRKTKKRKIGFDKF